MTFTAEACVTSDLDVAEKIAGDGPRAAAPSSATRSPSLSHFHSRFHDRGRRSGFTLLPQKRRRPALADEGEIRTRTQAYARWGKRALDVVGATCMIVVLAPLMALLAGLVALDGGRPIFGHRRVGRDGRLFPCLKLRTMAPDAQERLAAILASDPVAAEEWRRYRKLSNDPRITRIGGLLRKSSLDELPQLFNVLAGQMSLVGPRPVTAEELERYGPVADAYRATRPGLTGPWQVEGRDVVEYEDRVAIDRRYLQNVTFFGDIRILFMTAFCVVGLKGS